MPTSDNLLFYETQDGQQFSITYEVERPTEDEKPTAIDFGAPERMFVRPTLRNGATIPSWVYSEDEDRFLIVEQTGIGTNAEDEVLQAQTNLVVVDNWYPEVQSLAPATVQ